MPSTPDPCVIVIFGASGDLTSRKLIPALYEMHCAGSLPEGTIMLGVSRTRYSHDQWRDELCGWAQEHAHGFDEESWRRFAQRIFYHPGDATKVETAKELEQQVCALAGEADIPPNVLFYLSVAPSLYEPIVQTIDATGLVAEGRRWCSINREAMPWVRIIVEKPIGHDRASADALNRSLGRVFDEESIFRIDHYLGKEVVQNLLVLRFANSIFEPLWNHRYIDHVQISALETVGVGERAGYYDESGAIRDMIQSHLLQVLALVTMEPPTSFSAQHIRQQKIQAIDAIDRPPLDQLAQWAALGQYAGGEDHPAYPALEDVAEGSRTETYAAVKLMFQNWRWSGVPFYLRTGKHIARKLTEVVVQFKRPPANLFRTLDGGSNRDRRPANRLIIEVAPRASVSLRFDGKVPGPRVELGSAEMDFDFAEQFHTRPLEAYGPLLIDAMRGDQTLFPHRDEVNGSWRAVMPFLSDAAERLRDNIRGNYAPGTWGPSAADELLARDGRAWHNPD